MDWQYTPPTREQGAYGEVHTESGGELQTYCRPSCVLIASFPFVSTTIGSNSACALKTNHLTVYIKPYTHYKHKQLP